MVIPSAREAEQHTFQISGPTLKGVTKVSFLPANLILRSNGVLIDDLDQLHPEHLLAFDYSSARVTIHPFYVRPAPNLTFIPKIEGLDGFSFDWDSPTPDVQEVDWICPVLVPNYWSSYLYAEAQWWYTSTRSAQSLALLSLNKWWSQPVSPRLHH